LLTLRHEAFLAFVGRLLHDREFSEWFASQPISALASHGLRGQDLRDVAEVLNSERYEAHLAHALRPTVALLIDMVENARPSEAPDAASARYARLEEELQTARVRVSSARASTRPWWRFW